MTIILQIKKKRTNKNTFKAFYAPISFILFHGLIFLKLTFFFFLNFGFKGFLC